MFPITQKNVLPLTVAALAFAVVPAVAQIKVPSDKAHTFLEHAATLNGPSGDGAQGYHLKADYKLLDPAKGTVLQQGTLEEWSTGPWTYHRLYTEGKLSAEEWSINHLEQVKRKNDKLDVTPLDQKVARLVSTPLFQAAYFKSDVEMTGQVGTFSGETLDCVSAADPAAASHGINPNVIFPRLCFDQKDQTLRYNILGNTMTTYSDYKPFGPRQVAWKIEVKPYNHLGAEIDITTLEPLTGANVAPSGKTIPLPWPHQPGDAPLVPVRITECAYPIAARDHNSLGRVLIPVVIQKNGNVKSSGYPMGPQDLAGAAGDCVGNWKFQPFMIDGQPVETSDVLVYNYDGKPFNGKIEIGSQPAAK